MILFPPPRQVFTRRVREFNQCHVPAGSRRGGQFTHKGGECADGGSAGKTDVARDAGPSYGGSTKPWYTAEPNQQPSEAGTGRAPRAITEDRKSELLRIAKEHRDDSNAALKAMYSHLQEHEPDITDAAEALHLAAKAASAEFEDVMTALAKTLKVDLSRENVESDEFLAKTNEVIVLGPVKQPQRTAIKTALEYDGNVLRVKDMLRSSIVVNTGKDMADAIHRLREVMEIQVKDNVTNPLEGGWRAYNVIARLKGSGILAEIQIVTRPMIRAKKVAHPVYEQSRLLGKSDPDRPALIKAQEAILNPAWRASGGTTRRARKAFAAVAALVVASLSQGV